VSADFDFPEDARFAPGDRVVDRDAADGERDEAVVLRHRRDSEGDLIPAWAIVVPDAEADGPGLPTVSALNPGYDRNVPVATVAFVPWLNAHVGDRWRGVDERSLYAWVRTYCGEWGIPTRTYDYPEPRLAPVGDADD
jgi:hypothetical protein